MGSPSVYSRYIPIRTSLRWYPTNLSAPGPMACGMPSRGQKLGLARLCRSTTSTSPAAAPWPGTSLTRALIAGDGQTSPAILVRSAASAARQRASRHAPEGWGVLGSPDRHVPAGLT